MRMRKPFAATMVLVLILSSILPGTRAIFPQTASAYALPEAATQSAFEGPFRTRVTFPNSTARARLDRLGVVVLEEGPDWALVLADGDQLESLARLRFQPRGIDNLGTLANTHVQAQPWLAQGLQPLLIQAAVMHSLSSTGERALTSAQANLRAAMHALTPEQRAGIAALASVDTDGDGLTDDEEGYWCTDPNNPNSDGDAQGYTDGEEVNALLDFTLPRSVRWGYGPPFGPPNAWPDWNGQDGDPNTPACNDGDYDTIPDYAEVYVVGSRVPEESTDHDKFDDGQELFGVTYCPGAPTSCGYGNYPRMEYWSYIKATMPTWVRPPGDNIFVAAFPVPEVSVVPGSWTVERVTTITTEEGEMMETTHSYETSVMRGQSTSIANTVTWNEWEEVSEAIEQPIGILLYRSTTGHPSKFWGAMKVVGGGLGFVGTGCLAGLGLGTIVPGFGNVAGLIIGCSAGAVGGLVDIRDGIEEWRNAQQNEQGAFHYDVTNVNNVSASAEANATVILNQNLDFQGVVNSLDGVQYAINQQGAFLARGLYDISYAISQPRYTETRTNGRSWGGAQTTTHEVYEEHTVSVGEAFTTGQNWSTAWAVDSNHAADLTFNYVIQNTGTEYARELTGLIFNIYLGDDPDPIISYPAWEQFSGGKLENVFPDDSHPFASNPIPLTLEQMKRIDLGERLTVVLEDYSYGADELFYQDAINGGLTVFIEDGVDDGDELVDSYVIPTWGVETVQDVLTRYFPYSTDSDGNLNSLWTPEFDGINPPVWYEHFLSDIAWWNVYLTQDDAGNTPLHELPAQAGGAILFRFNRDSDRDGYQDRVEMKHYCALPSGDPDQPYCGIASDSAQFRPEIHPQPEVLAGYTATREGDVVTVLLKLANFGTFDAYGIDAVMYAPDDTVTIGNNTVGGNGRVRPGHQVAVGSLILSPDLEDWANSTADPYAAGSYAGDADRIYTFTVSTPGVVGQSSTALNWTDDLGGAGTLDLGGSYHAPLPVDVAHGLQLGFDTGTALAGESFTVQALTPRDTFTFTVESEPYTEPVIVVSYSDPQGSHKFITPVELASLAEDLSAYSGQMLPDVRVAIVTTGAVTATGSNTTYFVVNSPHPQPIENAHLYLNFVADGELVAELPYTMTMQPGPTVYPVEWSTSVFSQTYDAEADNILIAFWTDAQGNIIDSAARPLNTFQADPTPEAYVSGLTWDFTVTQGAVLEHSLALANTGSLDLLTYVNVPTELDIQQGQWRVSPADVETYDITLDTTGLPTGPYSETVTIRTSDPDSPETTVQVTGAITDAAPSAQTHDDRPLDLDVVIPGDHNAGEWIAFTHSLGPDPESLHPVKVYSQTGGTLVGVGKYATSFGGEGTASFGMFGDGSDGDLTVASGNTVYVDNVRTQLSSTSSAGQANVYVASISGFSVGDEVLVIQMQGTGAGDYEFGMVAVASGNTLTLQKTLANTYTVGGNSKAQVIRVPHYQNVTVQNGGILTAQAWDGNTGGVVAFRASGTATVEIGGSIDVTGKGFAGGATSGSAAAEQGDSPTGDGTNSTAANGTGGGGGALGDGASAGGGGGGGFGVAGTAGEPGSRGAGEGGSIGGSADLTTLTFGGAGGGGGTRDGGTSSGGTGGTSGGIVFIGALALTLEGSSSIMSTGNVGGDKSGSGSSGGGGGGAGGSIFLRTSTAALGTALVTAVGGSGGVGDAGNNGGAGGVGRIRVEYCESLSGTTNPPASTQQLDCYIVEQVESPPYTTARINMPESFTGGRTYKVQYGRRHVFDSAGNRDTMLRIPAGAFDSVTLDALVSEVGSGSIAFTLDVGDDGSWDWQATQSITGPVTLSSPDLADAFNQYWTDQGAPTSGTLDVPVKIFLSEPGQVILTNLYMPPAPADATLTAANISFSNTAPTAGDHVTVQAVVSNTEVLTATNIIVAFFAGDPQVDGVYIGADFLPVIPGNGTATATLDWDTEGFGGNIDLYVILDPTNRVIEADENNNSAFKSIRVQMKNKVFLPVILRNYITVYTTSLQADFTERGLLRPHARLGGLVH